MKKYIVIIFLSVISVAFSYIPDGTGFSYFPEHKYVINPTDYSRAESIHSYDIRHYQLNLNLPMTSGEYSGKARIKIVPKEVNFDTFNIHFVNLVCDSVKRGSTNLVFLSNSGRLKITLDRPFSIGETCTVDIFYRRLVGTANRGFYFYTSGQTGYHNLAYTTYSPYDARYWFPCFDELWDKAEEGCEMYITVPDSFTVCSNGLLDSVRTSQGRKAFYWNHRYPIATYLMVFTSTIYSTWSQWYGPTPAESIEIKYYVWRVDSTRAVTAFRNMLDMMQFYASPNMYGTYPFEKYGMNAVYPFLWGGMENQSMTMIHRQWLNGEDPGIAHELSHMWYGDKVTCFGWQNVWLNEGFATYSDALYTKHQQGQTAFINTMNQRANNYFNEDNSIRFPLYNPPFNYIFSWGHEYCKGSWVLHMLRYIEGDTTVTPGIFFQAMRAYSDSFAYKNASTEDYKRIHQQLTGQNLDWFFSEWIYQAGYPRYQYNWQVENLSSQYRVITRISQSNGTNAPAVFHMPLQIKFTQGGIDTTVTIPITASPEVDTFIISFSPTQMKIDPNNWVLKKATLDIEEVAGENVGKLLYKIYPNPTQGQIKIDYNLSVGNTMDVSIYNRAGQQVSHFNLKPHAKQNYVIWNGLDKQGRRVGAGVYFIKLSTANKSYSEKVIMLQ